MRRRPIIDGEQWLEEYRARDAHWIHDGNPKRPHPLLTTELHTNEYFNSDLVIEDPSILSDAALHVFLSLQRAGLSPSDIDRVVGPAMGAITIAHEIARIITVTYGNQREKACLSSYALKVVEDGREKRVFNRAAVRKGERVLVVEDVLMTGQSAESTAEAVRKMGGVVLPFVGALVNRTGLDHLSGKRVVALIRRPRNWWLPQDCPLCRETPSKAIRPKEKANWALLNAEY